MEYPSTGVVLFWKNSIERRKRLLAHALLDAFLGKHPTILFMLVGATLDPNAVSILYCPAVCRPVVR